MIIRKGNNYISAINKNNNSVIDVIKYEEPAPTVEPYLTFRNLNGGISLMSFTGNKTWDGTIEYSTDKENWTEWTGRVISSQQDIYLRGTGNTYITGGGTNGYSFQLNSNHRVSISGDIETLLDYQTVIQGNHPQ